jgi:hypothetical protein
VKALHAFPAPLLLCAATAVFYQAPAHAGMCTLTDSGAPLTTVNPKPFTVPAPSTCLVNGLPGVGSDLPGYILKATNQQNITVSGQKVGDLYDRVYCLGTGTTCDATDTYIIATRVRMYDVPNDPSRNTHCPVWSGVTNECFEINNVFRNIRGTNAAPVAAAVGYWMGTGSTTGAATAPDNSLAVKYLEYTGKTYKGLNQITPPTGVAADRNNTKVMFWADANVWDPDGVNSMWTPWMFVRQNCPFGGATNHWASAPFAIKYWQGGEEGQIQTNIQDTAFACKTM